MINSDFIDSVKDMKDGDIKEVIILDSDNNVKGSLGKIKREGDSYLFKGDRRSLNRLEGYIDILLIWNSAFHMDRRHLSLA